MKSFSTFVLCSTLTTTCLGHVHLLAPTGNEILEIGSTYEISWKITVVHPTQNWGLIYSTESVVGPWHDIALDIPVGENSSGSIHT